MSLYEYQQKIYDLIGDYVDQGQIKDFSFSVDYRSTYIGYIKGNLEFYNGSCLFFKEYVEVQSFINKLAYSFHYQNSEKSLVFRYDNAKHKPDLGCLDHKHVDNQIIPASAPDLEMIIVEILAILS